MAADNGTVVYNENTQAALSALTWLDRTGKVLGRVGDPGVVANPSISPDGDHVAVDIADLKANNVDVWIDRLKGSANARFTSDPAIEVLGVWSASTEKPSPIPTRATPCRSSPLTRQ